MVELGIILITLAICFVISAIVACNKVVRNIKLIAQKTVEDISAEAIKENARLNSLIVKLQKELHGSRVSTVRSSEVIERNINAQTFINDLSLIRDTFANEKEKPVIKTIINRIQKQYVGH